MEALVVFDWWATVSSVVDTYSCTDILQSFSRSHFTTLLVTI